MPKNDIDYSNTIIYKIYCKDTNIHDIYVGHTTNFIKRKCGHKASCNDKNNKSKIYETIRHNGGWENWDMVEIAKYNCKDSTEARIKEQEHYEELKSSMNTCPPYISKENYKCLICNINCHTKKGYEKHLECNLHKKKINDTKNIIEKCQKYVCDFCDFSCNKQSNYNQHLLTSKHLKRYKMIQNDTNFQEKHAEKYVCICGNTYKYHSGLWRHQKECVKNDKSDKEDTYKNIDTSNMNDKELIMMLIKENSELKNMMMEVIKTGTHNTTNNNCNNNNNSFNLNFFLNETCKDAMNIMDFVDSIKLQLTDLESVGELGYVKGLSNIIVKNLRALDVTKRPVHCSDAKREILYIKDNDVWEKEDPENPKMKKAVKYIAYKNTKLLPLWKQKYPECMQYDSSKSDKYNYMVIEAMGGMGDNEGEKINKIIKQIAKEVVIDKIK
jgi:hypothetical protein